MASGKSRRRRGGHPAKEAERRERERAKRETGADPLRHAALTACREAAKLDSALDAELWASGVLGSWWPPPPGLLAHEHYAVDIGGPLVSAIARRGGPGALAALVALGEVSKGKLGVMALRHANDLLASGVTRPAWGLAILKARVLRTAVMREDIFDDGVTIFIEAAYGKGERHAVGVYIDHNFRGMAKDILLADSIDSVEEVLNANSAGDRAAPRLEPIEQSEACARVHAAMQLIDITFDPPVGEDYARLRAFALLRAGELSGPFPDVSPPEVSPGERDRLRSDFLASPEGKGFDPEGDEAFVASLAIDFCADYLDGRPLRWSPVVVEAFMTGWLPRKVLADRSTFDAVPAALEAWMRYAGRIRAIPDWATRQSIEAIDLWLAEMFAQLDGDRDNGPGMEFLTAAKAAGVDLADQQALATFIAGWNARSDATRS